MQHDHDICHILQCEIWLRHDYAAYAIEVFGNLAMNSWTFLGGHPY